MAFDPTRHAAFTPLVVIPCLNETRHIADVVRHMHRSVQEFDGRVVVADGGSTDGTLEIVNALRRDLRDLVLLHNSARLQGPGINTAVDQFGKGHTHLVRVDAHCAYPKNFIQTLRDEAAERDAASVVVRMIANGSTLIQRLNAATQNARIGNGGSSHRNQGDGEYVDHGHHALIRLDAFREIGGYDAAFSHNEDAEFDQRLALAGHKIWLTANAQVTYFPRDSIKAVSRQYFSHGRGRAKNILKHSSLPKARQGVAIAVAPTIGLAALAPVAPQFALPMMIWIAVCLIGGVSVAIRERAPVLALSGALAMLMHLSWSLGFWAEALAAIRPARQGAST